MRQLTMIMALLWQVPLSILSFSFYRIMRFRLRKGAKKEIKKRLKRGEPLRWLGLSEVLKHPLVLPYVMVTGPRWNCHAVLGQVGPFNVQSGIDIQMEIAQKSAKQFMFIFYREDYQTEIFISSLAISKGKPWQKIDLPAGQYRIILRYYECQDQVGFPPIKIDGIDRIAYRSMDNEGEQYKAYLRKIQNHRGFFYYCLHYYIFNLLRWRKWLPESFVKREYLPVGNPETSFYYGSLRKGDIIQVNFDSDLLNDINVYITFYNLCSFPVFWENINNAGYHSRRVPCDGCYLIRVNGKNFSAHDLKINSFILMGS